MLVMRNEAPSDMQNLVRLGDAELFVFCRLLGMTNTNEVDKVLKQQGFAPSEAQSLTMYSKLKMFMENYPSEFKTAVPY